MIAVLFLLLLAPSALADDDTSVFGTSCPTKEEIDPYVKMCGHNAAVALQARYCADELVAGWTAAAQRLVPKLGETSRGARQSAAEESTKRSYDETARVLYAEILNLQRYTAVVADYPLVMIDLPDSDGDDSSLGCFNDAFHQVEDVVKYLDGEIVRAKKVYGAALALSETASVRTGSLAALGGAKGSRRAAIGAGTGTGAGAVGKSARSASTITGEIRTALEGSGAAAAELNRKVPLRGASLGAERAAAEGVLQAFPEGGLYSLTRRLGNLKGAEVRPAGAAESVGSLLWRRGEDSGAGAGLQLDAAGTEAPDEAALAARSVASSERDLFQLVSRRYRATELFRKAVRR